MAIESEIKQHDDIGTWLLADAQAGTNIIGSKLVLCHKLYNDGKFQKQKERLVAL